ncbi:hypothetical protein [Leucobacter musarum]|uniref:hypothetical protein n=1 Tax=Leucobacter musarum TaxID=1930747 RepID=UPI0006A7EE48|nr:hypothetical protein [Leucobacter musarum]
MTESHTHPHPANEHEASNGGGTVHDFGSGETLDHPVLDGSTEDYGSEGQEKNPRYGQENPELIRHPETGEETPTPDESA